ncbi:FkbM family methyltransferase [Novipirellula caenicola]|uniref:Methyltransferase FkbM domain-containing protein n=1 Tax=Novipirellula caenicola TaxID=1536901 RepID=A0ABP9VUF4_9BACT
MNIKQLILGTRIGDIAMFSREKIDILRTALTQPEAVGTLANDQLAGVLVASICQTDKTFLDVGAHIGSVISAVRKRDPAVEIIAVEAMPDKAARLREKFPHVILHACAVGENEGEATFFIDTQQTGYSSLIAPDDNTSHVHEIRVAIKRLDTLIPEDAFVDVMKIDIEGAELGALRGATNMLSRCRPVVMFESAPTRSSSSYEPRDIYQFFDQRGYEIVVPNRLAHDGSGLSEEGFIESHLYPRRSTNYFAVPRDRRIEIRDRARLVLGIHVA